MTMLVLKPGQFKVQVIYGSNNIGSTVKMGILSINEVRREIILSFVHYHLVASFKALSGFPWLVPPGNGMQFWIEGREKMIFLIEFENHESMKQVHELLKIKYLDYDQFLSENTPKYARDFKDRAAHFGINQCVVDSEDVESIRNSFDRFSLDSVPEPTAKRSRLYNPISDIAQGFPQVEKTLICSRNSIVTHGMNLANVSEEKFRYKKEETYSAMIYSLGRVGHKHNNAMKIDNVETSGFANLGNTCYMSSSLQGLFADAIFAKDLYKFCKMVEELGLNLDEEMPLSLALKFFCAATVNKVKGDRHELFRAVANLSSRRHCAPNHLKMALLRIIRDLSSLNFLCDTQQDAQEFLANILNKMQEECDRMLYNKYDIQDKQERDRRNPVTSNFAFVMESIIKCKRCKAVTKNKEESVILPISIQIEKSGGRLTETPELVTVQTLLNEHLKTEEVDKKCDICGFMIADKSQTFARIPRCLIVFVKRYSFNAHVAIKRHDEVGIPLYLTLNRSFVKEAAPYLPLSPTTIDARIVRSSVIESAESSETGTSNFVSKSAISTRSTTVAPETIYSETWKALEIGDEIASNKNFPSIPVSCRITCNKLDMQSKTHKVSQNTMDINTDSCIVPDSMIIGDVGKSNDSFVCPMPVPRDSDDDCIKPNFSYISSNHEKRIDARGRVCSFIEALVKANLADGEGKGKFVNSGNLSKEEWDENADRSNWCNSTKNDALSIKKNDATDLFNPAVLRLAVDRKEKEVENLNTTMKVSTALSKLTRGCSAFCRNSDSQGKSRHPTAVQDLVSNVKIVDFRSKINARTTDEGRYNQPEPLSRVERLGFAHKQLNLSRFDIPSSKDNYTDEDLYFMTEEEQIMVACERSIADQLRSFKKSDESSAQILQENNDEKQYMQYAGEQMTSLSSVNTDKDLEVDAEVEEVIDRLQKFEKQAIEQSIDKVMNQKSVFPVASVDLNVGTEMVAETKNYMKKFKKRRRNLEGNAYNALGIEGENISIRSESVLLNTDTSDSSLHMDANHDDDGARRKTYQNKNSLPTLPALLFRTKRVIVRPKKYVSIVNNNLLPESKQTVTVGKAKSLLQSINNNKDCIICVSPPLFGNIDIDIKSIGNSDRGSPTSSIKGSFSNRDGKKFGVLCLHSVPYKPLSYESRLSICRNVGMDFSVDWMVQSSVLEMEKPLRLIDISGNRNCLFQSLAYYITGSVNDHRLLRESIIGFAVKHADKFVPIKGWINDSWISHADLLTETGLGAELELYAFAAMFRVNVWVFHKKQWLCYTPKFFAISNEYEEISIQNYRIGEREGVYLKYEHYQFSPVLIPSNKISLSKIVLNDSTSNSDTSSMQEHSKLASQKVHDYNAERFLDVDAIAHENPQDAMWTSYRLISVVSHLGHETNSGHYVCDAWCNKSKSWLFCNDNSITSIDEESVLNRDGTGYIYFYLNSELFKIQ